MKNPLAKSVVFCVIALAGGCSSHPETGQVTGKVTIDGQPMTYGRVQFAPIATQDQLEVGKPAFGYIQSDGGYRLSTYGNDDGALVGQHRVIILNKSETEQAKAASKSGKLPSFDLLRVPNLRVDVAAGENTIDIPLTKEMLGQFGETD